MRSYTGKVSVSLQKLCFLVYKNMVADKIMLFMYLVYHPTEYTPRIPDPHIPVVACDTMQQMIGQLVVHYTSNTNPQGSPQYNGSMDQNQLKAHSVTSATATATAAAASAQNPVLSKLLMEDQEAPLDLSFKKIKPEINEQGITFIPASSVECELQITF